MTHKSAKVFNRFTGKKSDPGSLVASYLLLQYQRSIQGTGKK